MKKLFLLLTAALTLASCSTTGINIDVTNNASFDRKGEIVEVKVADLKADFNTKSYVLKSAAGNEVAYQLTGNGTLIFQAEAPANTTVIYTLTEGTPAEVAAKTFARYIPERKDDFAWENDLAAYRMYGPALANENPSNGVDLWLKRTDELIVDKFYHDELVNGLSYHVDHGQGLDCYKVGHTLGAGGIAPYTSQLWVGNHYTQQQVIETGALRSVFTLTFDSVKVDDKFVEQTITITTDAGSPLNKAVVKYEGENINMKLAGGIFLHDGKGVEFTENNIIAYAEDAVSDAGVPSGRNYVGVYIPQQNTQSQKDDAHLLLLADYTMGEEFTYYFGGGWSKWNFPTDQDWFNALKQFAQAKETPLQVSITE